MMEDPLPNDYSVGCGLDFALKKAYEKRLLSSDSARGAREVLIGLKFQNYEVDLDELTGTSDPPSCVSPTVFLFVIVLQVVLILGYLLYCQRQDAVVKKFF